MQQQSQPYGDGFAPEPTARPLFPQLHGGKAPDRYSLSDGDADHEDESDNRRKRPAWKINRKGTDHLSKFDGNVSNFKLWVYHLVDHISEDWVQWREILEDAQTVPNPILNADLEKMKVEGGKSA